MIKKHISIQNWHNASIYKKRNLYIDIFSIDERNLVIKYRYTNLENIYRYLNKTYRARKNF